MSTITNLSSYLQTHLTDLYNSLDQASFDAAFDSLFSQNLIVTFNGARLDRATYKTQIQDLVKPGELKQSATVDFSGSTIEVDVKDQAGNLFAAGSVGAFYTATIVEKLRVLGGPVTVKEQSSINVQIMKDLTVPNPGTTEFASRRVVAVDQISVVVPQAALSLPTA